MQFLLREGKNIRHITPLYIRTRRAMFLKLYLHALSLSQALPIDIQHPNEGVLFGGRVQGLIDVLHNPVKEMGVNVFGQGISGVDRLGIRHVLHIGLGGGHQLPAAQPVLHLLLLYTQQPTEMMQICVIPLQVQKQIVIV